MRFSRLGPFPQLFGKVKEWLTMIHVLACLMDFDLLCDRFQQGGVLKLMKMKNDHFLVFLAVWVFLRRFLGRLRSGLC